MQLAHPAEHRAAGEHLGGAAGLQMRGLLRGQRLVTDLRDGQLAHQVLHDALAIEEIERRRLRIPSSVAERARHDAGQAAALLGLLLAFVSEEHHALLVELDVLHAASLVVRYRAQKTRDDALAHDRLVGIHGVDELHGVAQPLDGHAQTLELGGLGEGIRHGLVEAGRRHGAVDGIQHVLHMGAHAEAAATAGQRLGDKVHAVQAQHLLVQVDLARQIGTERGGNHVQHTLVRGVFDLATQALQNLDDELARDLGAHHGAETRDAELQLRGGAGLGPHVDDALVVGRGGAYGAAGNLHDEGRGGGGTHLDAMVVHAALIAHGAFADKPEVAASAAGAACLERGGFQQDVHRIIGHLGIKAAHDAGQGNRALLGGGDDGHVAGKGALLAVERGQRLAVLRGAHHDVRTAIGILQLVQVERVQRLAEQEQDVVRDVDDVVDGTLADGRKALDHPVGAGAHLAAADDARRVARAALGVLDRDLNLFVDGGCGGVELEFGRHLRQRIVPVATVHRAHLAGQACDGEAVGTVRGDLQVEHGVGETGILGERDAHRGIFGQDHDAVVVAA